MYSYYLPKDRNWSMCLSQRALTSVILRLLYAPTALGVLEIFLGVTT